MNSDNSPKLNPLEAQSETSESSASQISLAEIGGTAEAAPQDMTLFITTARFAPGEIVRHRLFDFRGVIFDVDPVFANSDEWYESIPKDLRPKKEQPFYHILAENDDSSYTAYVSQQNLVHDAEGGPVDHPQVDVMFDKLHSGRYHLRSIHRH